MMFYLYGQAGRLRISLYKYILGVASMGRIGKFFREVKSEMKKVSWPKRKELVNSTMTVIATVVIFVLFFAVLDTGISELIRLILE
jgi:preprotein translocase subunit SecE